MDVHTISEESYKRGFERGYSEGICDYAADLLKGAVRWHRRFPGHGMPHCLIVFRENDGQTVVYPGSYADLLEGFIATGYGVVKREDVVMWGEIRPVTIDPPNA